MTRTTQTEPSETITLDRRLAFGLLRELQGGIGDESWDIGIEDEPDAIRRMGDRAAMLAELAQALRASALKEVHTA